MADKAEKNIGELAVEFLVTYYAKHEKKAGLLTNRHVTTQYGACANALLAYQRHDNTFFAASLDTSNSDHVARLLRNYKQDGLGKGPYVTALLLLSGVGVLCYLEEMWLALAVLPLLVAVAGFVAHSWLRKRNLQKQLNAAVDYLKKQPADHQWLGIQISSRNWRGNAMANYLSKLCERKGVGLLSFGTRARLTLHQEPRLASCRRHDFLTYYLQGDTLRKELGDQFMRVA